MPDPIPNSPRDPPAVPWSDVVRFVRQLSHDLRNHLNAAELQSVFLNEIATDAEMKGELKRLREMLSELGAVLQKLSSALTTPKPNLIPYRAADLVQDIRTKFENDFPDRKSAVQWQVEAGDAMVDVDPQLLQQALFELLDNAFQHRTKESTVNTRTEGSRFILTVREPKAQFASSIENWARQPFGSISQGHYGLGLNRVRAIVESHGGEFRAEYDAAASILASTIMLPLSGAGS